MISQNPFSVFKTECLQLLQGALGDMAQLVEQLRLDETRRPEFGELYSSVSFDLARRLQKEPARVADGIVKNMDLSTAAYVEEAKSVAGYVNFHLNYPAFSALTLRSAAELDGSYGYVRTESPLRIIVEHTSANPSGPIHVGTARNAVLGDCLARMLRARGHDVKTHFYINDVGRQVAIVAYGSSLSRVRRPRGVRADEWIGLVYAITSTLLGIRELKSQIESLRDKPGAELKLSKLRDDLYSYAATASELQSRNGELFQSILEGIERDEDPESSILRIIRGYEKGCEETKEAVRRIVDDCVGAFKQTLDRIGIRFDSWDWESSFVWDGSVRDAVERLRGTPYASEEEGALVLDSRAVIEDHSLKEGLGIGERYEIPKLTLTRADGTTLYTTRDVAYTIWKLERADKAINVIGFDQSIAQIQLKLALYILGYEDALDRVVHYAYELVKLPGMKMARRRGRYVTLDHVMDQAIMLAYEAVSEKSPHLSEDERRRIADFVGVGAVRYALASVDPVKTVEFAWDRVLDLEQNSAPFIQYAHARAVNIMRRGGVEPRNPDFSSLDHRLERKLVWLVARFPKVFIQACEELRPSLIADYANTVAETFNSYYASVPVLKAKSEGVRDARLMLVNSVRVTLQNALRLLGIKAPERM
ncbi:TPA: arginine--tRNA ligase [Candidatus Bathyarchaeota archaeon]|nr:arginine--tRNA ligase [Candidatus Bathyarchaeota archaeon]